MDALALGWVRGEFRAPLICEIEGIPYRALRRIMVEKVFGAAGDAVVVPVPDAEFGQRPAAFVRWAAGKTRALEDLRDELAGGIAMTIGNAHAVEDLMIGHSIVTAMSS